MSGRLLTEDDGLLGYAPPPRDPRLDGVAPWSGLPPYPGYAEVSPADPNYRPAEASEAWRVGNRHLLEEMTGDRPATFGSNTAVGLASPATIRAYHGTPHLFDRFDSSRIGTGEGAQAYGRGLYFAENEGVARGYRDRLAPPPPVSQRVSIDGRSFADLFSGDIPARGPAAVQVEAHGGNIDEAIAVLRARGSGLSARSADLLEPYRGGVASIEPVRPAGHMYEVNLRTEPERLVDWDRTLRRQPEAAQQVLGPLESGMRGGGHAPPTAGELMQSTGRLDEVSQALREAGIPGIRYLDQGSRGAGQGTHNYVMLDDKLIDIMRRYGVPGLLGGGAGGGALLGDE